MANNLFIGGVWASQAGGGTGIIAGIVDTYAELPDPSNFTNKLYYVRQGSGGLMAWAGFTKYPAGAYISDGIAWTLSQIQAQVSEDTITLVNSTDWAGFFAVNPTVNSGDTLIYNGVLYRNLTGTYTSTNPLTDSTNWGPVQVNSLQFSTATSGTPVEGEMLYNISEETMQIGEAHGVVQDVGKETYLPIINQTGSPLVDGSVVMYDGAVGSSGKLKAKYATITAGMESKLILGIITHTVTDGDIGLVTNFGKVRGLNTTGSTVSETWLEGDILYASTAIPGALTKVEPEAPYPAIPVAVIINVHAVNGILFVRPSFTSRLSSLQDVDGAPTANRQLIKWDSTAQYWKPVDDIDLVAKDVTGIPVEVKNNFTIAYDHTTRVTSFTKVSDWYYYYKGEKVNVTSTITNTAHTNAYGLYFYYFTDATGVVTISTTPWDLKNDVPICLVVYNPSATSTIKGFTLEERHGLRDVNWHYNQHFAEGAKYISGFDIANYTLNTDTVSATTWSVSSGVLADEDLVTTTTALPDGGPYTLLFFNASGQIDWITGSATPYFVQNNNITYNPVGSGLVEVTTNNRWFNLFQVEIPAIETVFQNVVMIGRTLYTSIASAQSETFGSVFARAGLIPEYVPVGEFTMGYGSGYSTTTGRSRIEAFQYIRGLVTIAGGNPTIPSDLSINSLTLGTSSTTSHIWGGKPTTGVFKVFSSPSPTETDGAWLELHSEAHSPNAGQIAYIGSSGDIASLASGRLHRFYNFNGISTYDERFTVWRDGRISGNALHNNANSVAGATDQFIASGTYTPTYTNITGTSGIGTYASQWTRVGNVVTVSGQVSIGQVSATTLVITLTLPITRASTSEEKLSGVACKRAGSYSGVIYGNTTTQAILIANGPITTGNELWGFTFTYDLS